jgi:hypothetical protein
MGRGKAKAMPPRKSSRQPSGEFVLVAVTWDDMQRSVARQLHVSTPAAVVQGEQWQGLEALEKRLAMFARSCRPQRADAAAVHSCWATLCAKLHDTLAARQRPQDLLKV